MSEERQDVEGRIERLRDLIEGLDVGALGVGSTPATAPDGQADVMTWPIRDEVVAELTTVLKGVATLREQVERLEQLRTTRWQGEDGGLPERLQIASTILMALGFPGPAGTCAGAAGHIEASRADREQVERLTPPHGTSAHDYYRAWRETVDTNVVLREAAITAEARADTLQRENEALMALVQNVDVGPIVAFLTEPLWSRETG